jgi:hypothetical protein
LGISKRSPHRNKFLFLFGWIFTLLFVIATIGVLFSLFPTRKLLDPDFYKQALAEVQIYQRLPETIAQQLASNFTQNDGEANTPVYLMLLDQQEWESIISNLISPALLQTQTENILDQFFAILLTAPDPVNTPIEVSLQEVKSRLAGPEGIQAFNQILNAQEPCSLDQLMGLLQLGLGMETSINTLLCRPPDYVISELNPVVEAFLSAAVDQMPNQVSFNIPFVMLDSSVVGNPSESIQGEMPAFIQNLRLGNTLISWSPLLPLGLILLVTIFVVRSVKDFFTWWGGALLTSGGISLLLSLVLFTSMNWVINRFIPVSSSDFGLSTLLLALGLQELSQELLISLVMSIVIPAAIITILGLVFLLGAYLLRSSSPPLEVPLIENPSPASNMDWG